MTVQKETLISIQLEDTLVSDFCLFKHISFKPKIGSKLAHPLRNNPNSLSYSHFWRTKRLIRRKTLNTPHSSTKRKKWTSIPHILRNCLSQDIQFNYPMRLVAQRVPPITQQRSKKMGIYWHKVLVLCRRRQSGRDVWMGWNCSIWSGSLVCWPIGWKSGNQKGPKFHLT